MDNHVDRCDQCGETTTDLDAGLCPSVHEMMHDCGGTWRRVVPWDDRTAYTIIATPYTGPLRGGDR